jgi:hypothetical protein
VGGRDPEAAQDMRRERWRTEQRSRRHQGLDVAGAARARADWPLVERLDARAQLARLEREPPSALGLCRALAMTEGPRTSAERQLLWRLRGNFGNSP